MPNAVIQVPRVEDITGRRARDDAKAEQEWRLIQARIEANRQSFASRHTRLSKAKIRRIPGADRSF